MTIDEIADLAFVSRSVVSRVLNDRPNVSDEARARVRAVIEEHGYRPNAAARSLATDRTYAVCMLAPRRTREATMSWIWPLLHLGISERCVERGYFVALTMVSHEMPETFRDRILHGRAFDGYILVTQEMTDLFARLLLERDAPLVLIGHDPTLPQCSSVDVDNYAGAYQATTHLTALGHRRVVAVLGPADRQETTDRREGYLTALAEADVPAGEARVLEGDYTERSGYLATRQCLAAATRPTALFYGGDSMAAGGLLALAEAGCAVPGDVAVVGFDDLPGARYTVPPLTTVHQPVYGKGERAADLLIDRIEAGEREPVHATLEPKLVVRESCGAS